MPLNQPYSCALEVNLNRRFDEFIHNKVAGLGSYNVKGGMLKWTNKYSFSVSTIRL